MADSKAVPSQYSLVVVSSMVICTWLTVAGLVAAALPMMVPVHVVLS